MIKVIFKTKTEYSLDGINVIKALKGDKKELPEGLAEKFIEKGFCAKEPTEKALKDKMEDKKLHDAEKVENKEDEEDFFGEETKQPPKGRGRRRK